MKLTNSRVQINNEQIYWYLYGYRIDLNIQELTAMIKQIKLKGLFSYLENERPALKHQLINILNENIPENFNENKNLKISKEKFMESFLEQCLLEIYYKIK